ncbi:MAG: inositol phosphatase [Planctomycetia bacterium]|nr:inositol phosphatase [Planctomycetia bacterium]
MVLPVLDALPRLVEVARDAARAAAAVGLKHWRRLERVDKKADGSPVTVADREAEDAAVAVIERACPGMAILGEEGGPRGGEGATRWIIDPLDGTIGYARGGVMWGPLVALEHAGAIVAGAMELPVLRSAYWAGRGLGCFRDGERVRVSATDQWKRAILSLGGMKRAMFDHPRGGAVEALVRTSRTSRAYGDVGSCAMLLDGTADVWIEAGVKVWDLAAPRILVEEAGGRFTDFDGVPGHTTGEAIASNGHLHAHVVAAFASAPPR